MDAIMCPKCEWQGTEADLEPGRMIYQSTDRYEQDEYALSCPRCGFEYSEGFTDIKICDGCGEFCDHVVTTPEQDEYCYKCFKVWLEEK